MEVNLRDKVALVTGAARGLGLLIAQDLAREGMRIAGLDTREDELQREMAALGASAGTHALAVACDVSREPSVVSAITRVIEGLGRIDVVVCNAGIREVGKVWEMSTDDWDRVLDTNLKGAFLVTREVLRQDMLERGEGSLIYISSLSGKRGEPEGSIYCASKWGVLGFAASVAKDLKDTRIRATSIVPGMIETPMARESEVWDLGMDWLDPAPVSRAVAYCVKQEPTVHIPEIVIHHRTYI